MRKSYSFGDIQYRSVGRKWSFTWPQNQTLLVQCRGRAMAEKTAHIVAGSLKRSKNMLDNLARANITQLLNRSDKE
jgi:hypothetical protein